MVGSVKTALVTLAACGLVAVSSAGAVKLSANGDNNQHECNAPCTVKFPLGVEEDQWDINYWVMHRDHHPRLQVWVMNRH